MASGSFSGNIGTPSGGFALKVEYDYTQSISGNYSTLNIYGYIKKNNSTYKPWNLTNSAKCILSASGASNGSSWTSRPDYDLRNTMSWVKVGQVTGIQLNHNDDGTKSTTIGFSFDGALSSYYPKGSISKTITLQTIPRVSSITVPVITMGRTGVIKVTRASSSFTHTITAKLENYSATIVSKSTETSISWSPPLTWANALPNTNGGSVTYTIQTFSGSTLIGSKVVTQTISVPTLPPSISSVVISEVEEEVKNKFKAFVQGKSKLNIKTTASGQYSATIKGIQIEIDNQLLSGNDVNTDYIKSSGKLGYKVTVTDSRQTTNIKTGEIDVLGYKPPQILDFGAARCDNLGNPDNKGVRIKVIRHFDIVKLNNLNDKQYKIQYKQSNSNSWIDLITGNVYSMNDTYISDAIFDINKSYEIRIVLTDYFNSNEDISVKTFIATGFKLINFGKNGSTIKLGGWAQKDNALEIGLDVYLSNTSNLYIDTGDKAHDITDMLNMPIELKANLFSIGWIDPNYVELEEIINTRLKASIEKLELIDAPSSKYSNVIGTILKDKSVIVLGYINILEDTNLQKFYRVIYEGMTGYCLSGYFNSEISGGQNGNI